jgi:pimeloyl-ACP methyl ester carboxylesterase
MAQFLLGFAWRIMQADLVPVHRPARAPKKVLFLVHGTYAKHAAWVRGGSRFCERLLQDLGPEVSVQAFMWSGRNSIRARDEAASRLRELLQESLARFRKVPHIVIGHSHGGNVALRALACADLASVRAVCLSTPIIHLIPRRELATSKAFVWLMSVLPVAVTLAVFLALGHVFENLQPRWLFSNVAGSWIFLAILLCSLTHAALAKSREMATRMAELIEIPECGEDRVLFLRFAGDEASLTLTAFQAMQYAVNSLLKTIVSTFAVVVSLYRWSRDSNWVLAGIGVPLILGLVAAGFKWNTVSMWLVMPMVIGVMIGLLVLAFIVLLSFCALFLGAVSTLVAIPAFGFRLALASFWIELCIEASPFGQSNTVVLTPSAETAAVGLRHSFCYQEQPAIQAIVQHVTGKRR